MEESKPLGRDFYFGLVSGIAIVAVIGLLFMVTGGNFGSSAKAEKKSNTNSVAAVNSAPPTADEPAAPAIFVDYEPSATDHVRGNKNADITIVTFSDFQCPYCSRFHDTMLQVMDEYGDDVRWVYKHFPLDSIHPEARPAAEAAECAGDQGKFWEYADALNVNQSSLGEATYTSIAKQLGLDQSKFQNCIDSGEKSEAVNTDYQMGLTAGVRGTPGNFINGQSLPGAVPFSQMQSAIESFL
jgi:protein-disulfide isomerase